MPRQISKEFGAGRRVYAQDRKSPLSRAAHLEAGYRDSPECCVQGAHTTSLRSSTTHEPASITIWSLSLPAACRLLLYRTVWVALRPLGCIIHPSAACCCAPFARPRLPIAACLFVSSLFDSFVICRSDTKKLGEDYLPQGRRRLIVLRAARIRDALLCPVSRGGKVPRSIGVY